MKAPAREELERLVEQIAERVARELERMGLLQRDAVKLIDVHPDGFQELVRGDVIRAKFRNRLETPEPLVPGAVTRVAFVMPDVFHTFRRGHRLMIQVQGSWFPLVDRNPQRFVDIYRATEADFQTASQRLYRSPAARSRVVVNVVGPRLLP